MNTQNQYLKNLDMLALAKKNALLTGNWSLKDCPRIQPLVAISSDDALQITWEAQFFSENQQDARHVLGVTLSFSGHISLICQRCLQPFILPIDETRRFYLTANQAVYDRETLQSEADFEDEAETHIDFDSDWLLVSDHFDFAAVIEDEVILSLPIIPKHEHCPDLPDVLQISSLEPDAQTDASLSTQEGQKTRKALAGLSELIQKSEKKK